MTQTETTSGVTRAARTEGETVLPVIKTLLAASLLIVAIGGVLLSEYFTSSGSVGGSSVVFREITAACRDSATQWMIAACLIVYVGAFLLLESRKRKAGSWKQIGPSAFCFRGFLALILLRYAVAYRGTGGTLDFLVLLAGIVFGKGIAVWIGWFQDRTSNQRLSGRSFLMARSLPVFILVTWLGGTALWQPETTLQFQYHGIQRWSGVWNNPNIYGLFMGLGTVLSFGFLISSLRKNEIQGAENKSQSVCSLIIGFLSFVAMPLCGIGLFKSYSRGAWIATLCGLGYFAVRWFWVFGFENVGESAENKKRTVGSSCVSWFYRNRISLAVVLLSLGILSFWQFRFSEWSPARRAFSVVNVNDFSWRNRVAAWKGAILMMADKPFFGFGWGQAESAYEKDYRPEHLDNGAAIQMNDYFMIGISAGVPAMVCFLAYVWLALREPGARCQVSGRSGSRRSQVGGQTEEESGEHPPSLSLPREEAMTELDWLKVACRAGAIVLLVGFWFDGGLFKLATGSVFWMLLELGREEHTKAGSEKQKAEIGEQKESLLASLLLRCSSSFLAIRRPLSAIRRWTWLHWTAGALLALALIQTSVNLSVPYFHQNHFTLAVSRQWLIPPKALDDFNLLAANPLLKDQPLRIPLSHAGLVNYNRQLLSWQVDDAIYREYVLSPIIEPSAIRNLSSADLAWRRPLWEHFYPSIRRESDPRAAAEIVLKNLRKWVRISSDTRQSAPTIEEMWRRKTADKADFESLYVAALRSVGVPARLSEHGTAELFTGTEWKAMEQN